MTTTTSAFLSVPTIPHKLSPPKQRLNSINGNRWSSKAQTSSPNFIRRCSNSNSTSVAQVEKDGGSLSESMPTIDSNSLRGCKGCGREEIENGCNGEGRIQGGIATVPGFGWWPIKAYRPCPGFVASGGRYTRRGQSMDEVAGFGKVGRGSPVGTNDEA